MSHDLTYQDFLDRKFALGFEDGFEPTWMPDSLFPFQRALVEWACRKGRAAIFADCGLGKTPMQLVWAENVRRKTGRPVLILTPLAVSFQTVEEGKKFGVDVQHRRDGLRGGEWIVVTNYERLHKFAPNDFSGVVCDESSILKNFDGKTRKDVTEFLRKRPYRLLCTATAAPNDYVELGTSAEALGVMERRHMLSQFFTHDGGDTATWRLKGHARASLFWRWVCSWARACRKPSDLGFDDGGFTLPLLTERQHSVATCTPLPGYLFDLPAVGLTEQRDDLRRTLQERCELAAHIANSHNDSVVCWTNLNSEADLIASLGSNAVNVQGSDSDEWKEEAFQNFVAGKVRMLVSKPSIAGFGLNWQHCSRMTFFPSHSYEQFYQCVRRCWRFGQTRDVTVDIITTEGQLNVLKNMQRKSSEADKMFAQLTALMTLGGEAKQITTYTTNTEIPLWL